MQWIKAINWSVHVVPVWIKPLDNFLLYISVRNNQLAFFKALYHIFWKPSLCVLMRCLGFCCAYAVRRSRCVVRVYAARLRCIILYMYSVSTLCCAYVVFWRRCYNYRCMRCVTTVRVFNCLCLHEHRGSNRCKSKAFYDVIAVWWWSETWCNTLVLR